MDAVKILAIQERYMNDPEYSYPYAALDLIQEGCTPVEATRLLLQVDSFLEQEETVEVRPENCVCSNQLFDVYGCMCQKRRMPG